MSSVYGKEEEVRSEVASILGEMSAFESVDSTFAFDVFDRLSDLGIAHIAIPLIDVEEET